MHERIAVTHHRAARAQPSECAVKHHRAYLAWLAAEEEERTTLLATTDFNEFEACRLPRGRRFPNLIGRA